MDNIVAFWRVTLSTSQPEIANNDFSNKNILVK